MHPPLQLRLQLRNTLHTMAYVFKIKCGDVLRRVTIPQQQHSSHPDITFTALESRIRDLFGLNPTVQLVITYTDGEGDNVTMGDESDLIDACVGQSLNPLRLYIATTAEFKPLAKPEAGNNDPSSSMDLSALRGLLPDAAVDGIKQLIIALPSLALRKAVDGSLKAIKEAQASVEAFDKKGKTYPERNDDRNRDFHHYHHNPPQGAAETAAEQPWVHHNIHRNVECDVCGMTPIVGTRYKSLTKEDYDLCSDCFKEIGNSTEYQQIDRPQSDWPFHSGRPHPFRPCNSGRMMRHRPMHPQPFLFRPPPGFNPQSSCCKDMPVNVNANADANVYASTEKLDARFVKHVTIFDGTEMPPATSFTKIWRFKNVGMMPLPLQTLLVHVGGDILGPQTYVSLQLPKQGLAVDEEIEVSVDLISPERPGRYVSHWQLIAPTGQKFGQRVWVMIQVVAPGELLPVAKDLLTACKQTSVDVNGLRDPQEGSLEREGNSQGTTLVIPYKNTEPIVATRPETEHLNVVEIPDLLNGSVQKNFAWKLISKPVTEKTSEAMASGSLVFEKGASQSQSDRNEPPPSVKSLKENVQGFIEEACLGQLESMGFTQRSINLELLQKNKNNLQKTIEDLIAASNWAPLLRSLEEMGFSDKEMNMRLMLKNSGNLKLVVKDLVEMQASAENNSASWKAKENSL